MLFDRFGVAAKLFMKNGNVVEARCKVALGFALGRERVSDFGTGFQGTFIEGEGLLQVAPLSMQASEAVERVAEVSSEFEI